MRTQPHAIASCLLLATPGCARVPFCEALPDQCMDGVADDSDTGASETTEISGSGDGDGDGDPSGDGDGDPSGDGDGDPSGDGDGDPSGDGDGDPGCQYWEISYDLEGSVYELADTPFGVFDQINVVTMPYDADEHVGPGSFVIRFEDIGGQPGGQAHIVAYAMITSCVVSANSSLQIDLTHTVAFEECGVTHATLAGGVAAWEPAHLPGYHSMGSILCNGFICGIINYPDGVPQPVDETVDHPLEAFTFADDFSSFTAPTIIVEQDENATWSWEYMGVEVSRVLVDGPDCLCAGP